MYESKLASYSFDILYLKYSTKNKIYTLYNLYPKTYNTDKKKIHVWRWRESIINNFATFFTENFI